MTRTALFGGSFDPVHMGHAMLANFVAGTGLVDEVWFMPGRINPLKSGVPPVEEFHRSEMCRLVAEDCRAASVCDIEFSMPAPSYTSRTLKRLVDLFPGKEFQLLIGSDNWLCFDRWRDHEWICSNFRIIVYPRPGYEIGRLSMPENVSVLKDAPQALISSTFVRDGLAQGRNMNFFVPQKVLNYITKNRLYE